MFFHKLTGPCLINELISHLSTDGQTDFALPLALVQVIQCERRNHVENDQESGSQSQRAASRTVGHREAMNV